MGSWEIPELFHFLQEKGEVEVEEMFRVFNMGIGMVAAVDPKGLAEILGILRKGKQRAAILGSVQKGSAGVAYDLGTDVVDAADAGNAGDAADTGEEPGPAA